MTNDRRARREHQPPWIDTKGYFKRTVLRFVIHLFGLIGLAVVYYVGFSILFDTPVESQMKASYRKLSDEYDRLTERYDSVEVVLNNVVDRDRNVFGIMFESEPYDFDGTYNAARIENLEGLLTLSNRALGNDFMQKIQRMDKTLKKLIAERDILTEKVKENGDDINFIPAIQPVINKDLTLLTASYGQRIHPFYKTLVSHQGVDYTVPENTRVFATADGVVKDALVRKTSTSGMSVIIDHGNGYTTMYNHLNKINVKQGQRVKRGDIIALTGNTGLSLAPHLHYEISRNGMRVDPVHYFFIELSPVDYQRIMNIAQSGMQSFD